MIPVGILRTKNLRRAKYKCTRIDHSHKSKRLNLQPALLWFINQEGRRKIFSQKMFFWVQNKSKQTKHTHRASFVSQIELSEYTLMQRMAAVFQFSLFYPGSHFTELAQGITEVACEPGGKKNHRRVWGRTLLSTDREPASFFWDRHSFQLYD